MTKNRQREKLSLLRYQSPIALCRPASTPQMDTHAARRSCGSLPIRGCGCPTQRHVPCQADSARHALRAWGNTDITVRLVANGLAKQLKQVAVVENIGGSGGGRGTGIVAKGGT